MENTFDGKIQQKNNIFQSSKHAGNGIGIESVRHITDKNGGACDFTYKDGIFSAKIIFAKDRFGRVNSLFQRSFDGLFV